MLASTTIHLLTDSKIEAYSTQVQPRKADTTSIVTQEQPVMYTVRAANGQLVSANLSAAAAAVVKARLLAAGIDCFVSLV